MIFHFFSGLSIGFSACSLTAVSLSPVSHSSLQDFLGGSSPMSGGASVGGEDSWKPPAVHIERPKIALVIVLNCYSHLFEFICNLTLSHCHFNVDSRSIHAALLSSQAELNLISLKV
jgi:hypothetical protein